MAIQIGDTIGDYQVVAVLGRGGMGKVFRVRNLLSNREEAMKVVAPEVDDSPELAERFLREIRVHASLEHPNIAALRTAFRVDDRIIMLLELVEGVSLEEKIREGPMDAPAAVRVMDQVLSALVFAHARGVIHRDIKPANILLAAGGPVKLTDFGIARAARDLRLTHTGFALGSLPYMSPEQIRGGPIDERSDLYSLGVTFYEAVTGKRPIAGASEFSLMNAQLLEMPAPPIQLMPGLPQPLSDLILVALAKNPDQRFRSAAQFQSALRALPQQTGQPAAALAISAEEKALAESRLVRVLGPIARHVVADAAPRYANFTDLCHGLAEQIPDARERETFLKACLHGAGTTRVEAARGQTTVAAPNAWDPAWLGELERSLAQYVGPIAKMLVKEAALQARNPEELCARLGAEIPNGPERERFLAAVHR